MPLTFTLGQPCAGGNHWDVTIDIDGRAITLPSSFPDLKTPLDDKEFLEFASFLLRHLVSGHPSNSINAIRGILTSASLTVSL